MAAFAGVAPAGRVIVWVDDSLASLAAPRRAVAEARQADMLLYPVRVARTRLAYQGNMPPPRPAPVTGLGERSVRTAFDRAMGGLPTGVEIRVATVRRTPGRLLVELADREDDLLVVGDDCTAGHGGPLSCPRSPVTAHAGRSARWYSPHRRGWPAHCLAGLGGGIDYDSAASWLD